MELLYCDTVSECLCVLIPKKRGSGYLKNPFGGHHSNEKYWKFISLPVSKYTSSCCDVDGYLEINLIRYTGTKDVQEINEEIAKELIKMFDQCSGIKKINRDQFFDIIENEKPKTIPTKQRNGRM